MGLSPGRVRTAYFFFYFITLGLELSDTTSIRALDSRPPRNCFSLLRSTCCSCYHLRRNPRMSLRYCLPCRGASLIRNYNLLALYSRTMPRAPWWSWGGGLFLMSDVSRSHIRRNPRLCPRYCLPLGMWTTLSWDLSGRGTTRAEDVQGTPAQDHISPSILVYENYSRNPFEVRCVAARERVLD